MNLQKKKITSQLLLLLSKIFERLIHEQLSKYCMYPGKIIPPSMLFLRPRNQNKCTFIGTILTRRYLPYDILIAKLEAYVVRK